MPVNETTKRHECDICVTDVAGEEVIEASIDEMFLVEPYLL